jgi:hypothetical protein
MNQFEEFNKACDEVEDRDFNLAQENVIEFLKSDRIATVTFTRGRFISKIRKLAELYPDEVQITAENKDGSIVAHVPVSYIHISRSKREMTDEERELYRQRARNNFGLDNLSTEND